jgi:hypothetical protein
VKIYRKATDEASDRFFERVSEKALANLTSLAS